MLHGGDGGGGLGEKVLVLQDWLRGLGRCMCTSSVVGTRCNRQHHIQYRRALELADAVPELVQKLQVQVQSACHVMLVCRRQLHAAGREEGRGVTHHVTLKAHLHTRQST